MIAVHDPAFNGAGYQTPADHRRLTSQHARIKSLMMDGLYRTFSEIALETGDPEASISAQLRHLRKARFGGWIVLKRARGNRDGGLFEYQLKEAPTELFPRGTT